MSAARGLLLAICAGCAADSASPPGRFELGYVRAGAFVPYHDGDRVPAEFGSQGALMLVSAARFAPPPSGAVTFTVVATDASGQTFPMKNRRLPEPQADGTALVTGLHVVVEWVGPGVDTSAERIITLDAAWGDLVHDARVTLDIQGSPYPSHPTSPDADASPESR